jgi:hypothetical protein
MSKRKERTDERAGFIIGVMIALILFISYKLYITSVNITLIPADESKIEKMFNENEYAIDNMTILASLNKNGPWHNLTFEKNDMIKVTARSEQRFLIEYKNVQYYIPSTLMFTRNKFNNENTIKIILSKNTFIQYHTNNINKNFIPVRSDKNQSIGLFFNTEIKKDELIIKPYSILLEEDGIKQFMIVKKSIPFKTVDFRNFDESGGVIYLKKDRILKLKSFSDIK